MQLSSRERVHRAVTFGGVDRVPIMHAVLPAAWYRFGKELNRILERYPRDLATQTSTSRPATAGYAYSDELARTIRINDDFAYVEPRSYQYGREGMQGLSRDEWGCLWRRIDPGIVGQVIEHPLQDWDRVAEYRFADPLAYWRFDLPNLEQAVADARAAEKYIIGYGGNLFELMQWLVGHAQLLITIMEQPDRIRYLADRIVDYNVKTVQQLSTLGLDAILFQDDWGTQRQLMIRPERWRELFKPYYRRMFSCVREHGMQVHFHTDGYTLDIIPDLIEVGADVLNPQFSVMDLDALARAAAGKVCIRTDIDRQYVLTRATPEEVREYMRRALELFSSPRGGYIAYGEINSDASLENVEAMYEALEEFGRYEPADEDSTEESGSG